MPAHLPLQRISSSWSSPPIRRQDQPREGVGTRPPGACGDDFGLHPFQQGVGGESSVADGPRPSGYPVLVLHAGSHRDKRQSPGSVVTSKICGKREILLNVGLFRKPLHR